MEGTGADVIVQLIDWLGVSKVHVVGIDYGVLVTVALLALHPKRIGKFVFACDFLKTDNGMGVVANNQSTDLMSWFSWAMPGPLTVAAGKVKKRPVKFYVPSKTVG